MKGWLDNFGKADNANNSKVSMSEDFVGLSYDTKGRNYSPAWGGQFEHGGEIAQRGKKIDQILNANKNLDWVKGLYDPNYGSIQIPGQEGRSTHFMESADRRVYPTIRKIDGELVYLGDDAYNYADSTNSYIEFPTDRKARKFAKNYKRGTGVLDFQNGGERLKLSPLQQIQQAVEPTPTVPYLQTKDPAEFYKSWIQSPEYERRLKATGYSDVPNRWHPDKLSEIEEVKKQRLNLLENIQPLEYDPSKRSEAFPFDVGGPTINVNPSDYKTFSKQSVEAHEIAHVGTPTMGGNEFGIFMGSMLPLKKPVLSGVQGSKEREAAIETLEDFEHLQKPLEAKADLDALRFMMYDKGIYDITKGKKFTETDFEKAKQSFEKDRVFKRLTDRMGKKNFINLMNIIAKADDQEEAPIAMGGMSIPGSVGFTYARVSGAAPSKGKYAKKTMASAQNGIMSPMLLARNVLNYFYPSEEAAPTVAAAPVEYKKGLTDELLKRQAYKESTFNPAAVSPAGYKGLTQIGESVLKDYSKKKGGKKLDPFNPEDAVELQKFAMDDLYNASFINKPNQPDSVRLAKTLAAYNWGRGNLANYLNEQKSKGIDIYDSYDWLNNLPKETSDYVNKILLQEDPSFNKNYKKASTNPKYEDITSLYDQKKFGGDIPSAQNGQEMRFYQNGLDWKPKSMQPGGNIERVSINDPRYPELHKNRQVGAYYDGAYSLPDLPEVVVTGKDERLKEAMYEGSNKFGMNALGLMSAPQVVMMEALTGKQQTPSEAFGFQDTGGWLDNPISFGKNLGNFAIDAALDPINLLGVGVADDVARGAARVIANKPVQQFGRAAGSSDKVVFDLMDESIDPFGEALKNVKIDNTPSPFAEEVRKEALAYQALTRDPRYLERVKRIDKDFGSKLEPLLESFNRNQPEGSEKFLPFNISIEDTISSKGTNSPNELDPMGVSGLTESGRRKFEKSKWALPWPFNIGSDKLKIDPATDRYITIGEKSHMRTGEPVGPTVHHELKHHWTNAMIDNQNYNYKLGLKDLISPRSKVITDPRDVTANQDYKYFSYGTEVDAHLMTNLRDEMVKRGYLKDHFDELSEGKLNDFLSKEKDYRGVGEYFNPSKPMVANKSKFVDFFNTYGLPSTVIGGVLGGQAIDKQKNGGITKDNQGYWNPDNWGKPVEIDSNDITMEGVYEPLLGVSDTGDTKLMKPGKNYKFKGKKVTEYPVAQWGEGVPFKEAATPTKNISNPLNLPKELVPYIKPKASFEEQKRIAKLELDKYGYTSDQRKNYIKGKSEKAFKNIVPQGYGDLTRTLDRIERYEKNLGRNPEETLWYGAEDSSTGKPIYYDLPKRDDAFALYLGLPQKNKSFGISEYQPGDSKENKYYYKPNYLDENLKNRLVASYFSNVEDGKNTYIANERGDAFPQKTDSLERAGVPFENPMYAEWMVDNALGDFKMSKGKDEKGHYVSIYDVWDLNPFKQGEGSSSNPAAGALKVFAKMKGVDVGDETEMSNLFGAGKPFEIYDRIYYDPKTKKVIPQKRNGGGVGINQLDAQPMKKLNQLLNFTNNPDKDNWLDKYN